MIIGVSHRAHSIFYYNILNYIIYCKTGTNICIWGHLLNWLKSSYINICPRKLVNVLCALNQLMYSYFGNFLYTVPGQPEGPRLYKRSRAPSDHAGYCPVVYVCYFTSYCKNNEAKQIIMSTIYCILYSTVNVH